MNLQIKCIFNEFTIKMHWKWIYNKNSLEMNLQWKCIQNEFTIKMH